MEQIRSIEISAPFRPNNGSSNWRKLGRQVWRILFTAAAKPVNDYCMPPACAWRRANFLRWLSRISRPWSALPLRTQASPQA